MEEIFKLCFENHILKDQNEQLRAMLRRFAEFGYLNMHSGGQPKNDVHACAGAPACLHCEAFKVLRDTEKTWI